MFSGGGSSPGIGAPSDAMLQTGQTDGTAIAHLKGINEGVNSTASVAVQPGATSNNGAVISTPVVVAADQNPFTVLATPTTVYAVVGFNKGAAPLYVKLYDKTSAANAASDVPKLVFGAAPNGYFQPLGAIGAPFLNGCVGRAVTDLGHTGTGAPTAGDAVFSVIYAP